jgi:tetratricopeptide (TPR) repeat protein
LKKVLALLCFCLLLFTNVAAYEPYINYTYSKDTGNPQTEPQAYIPTQVVTGKMLGLSNLASPEDIYVSKVDEVYITDTGNQRIIKLDKNLKLIKVIDSFMNNGVRDTFKQPQGIFVDDQTNIYIADTENSRIVKLNQNGDMISVFLAPVSPLINQSSFKPCKLVVDFTGRMFVVSASENKGLIALEKDGGFSSFLGSVQTPLGLSDFFKAIATQKQRETMQQTVPVVYSNVDIDPDSIIYTSVSMVDVSNVLNDKIFIRKLNPMGKDILNRNGLFPIMGDIDYIKTNNEYEISNFCDITYFGDGMYSALGQRFGRIFTYDKNGNLLYIFGGKGNSFGQFANPVSLDTLGDKYLVLDRNNGQFVVFEPTEYGILMKEATTLYTQRKYDEAEAKYDQLLNYTSRSDVAYLGKANCLYKKSDYVGAMRYYKLANEKKNYAEAFKYYRADLMNKYFGTSMTVLIALIVLVVVIYVIKRKRRKT